MRAGSWKGGSQCCGSAQRRFCETPQLAARSYKDKSLYHLQATGGQESPWEMAGQQAEL